MSTCVEQGPRCWSGTATAAETRLNFRDLTHFNTAIGSKLRGCDLLTLKVADVQAAGQIYQKSGDLRAARLLLGHTKMDRTVRHLSVEPKDVLAIADAIQIYQK